MTVTVLGSRKVASFCVTYAWRWGDHFSAPFRPVFSQVSEGDILQMNKVACCSGEPAWAQSYKTTYLLTFKAWWKAGWVPNCLSNLHPHLNFMILPLAPSVVDKFKEDLKAFSSWGMEQEKASWTVPRPYLDLLGVLSFPLSDSNWRSTYFLRSFVRYEGKKWPSWSRPAAGRDQVGKRFKSCGLWVSDLV